MPSANRIGRLPVLYQNGVNWAALATANGGSLAASVLGSGITTSNPLLQSGVTVRPGAVPIPSVQNGGGLFGLALSTSRFAAVIGFLETQGEVQTCRARASRR